jgi:hypothetical protein
MIFEDKWRDYGQVLDAIGDRAFLYVPTGQFGNQLLGLVTAKYISLTTGFRPTLLFPGFGGNQLLSPTWLQRIRQTDWFDLILGEMASLPGDGIKLLPLQKMEDLHSSNRLYTGFIPNHKMIAQTGLLTHPQSPFHTQVLPMDKQDVAICVRRGDYLQNPHLGILPMKYYRKALQQVWSRFGRNLSYRIFVDCKETQRFVKRSFLHSLGPIAHSNDFIDDWTLIRNSKIVLSSNSTFAYTASLRPSIVRFFPDPFYIADEGFQQQLFPPDSNLIPYTMNTKLRYLHLRLKTRARQMSNIMDGR